MAENKMTKDKQIEEMAKDFCAVGIPCEECHLYKNRCHAKKYATRAYNNGYHKASEIFEEIEQHASIVLDEYGFHDFFKIPCDEFAELKKKYESEDT